KKARIPLHGLRRRGQNSGGREAFASAIRGYRGVMSRVGIVIVNYRTPALVIDCLRSLADEAKALPGGRVVVVENCSGDDSANRIGAAIDQERWSAWAELLPLAQNAGFAGGNNAAI